MLLLFSKGPNSALPFSKFPHYVLASRQHDVARPDKLRIRKLLPVESSRFAHQKHTLVIYRGRREMALLPHSCTQPTP